MLLVETISRNLIGHTTESAGQIFAEKDSELFEASCKYYWDKYTYDAVSNRC